MAPLTQVKKDGITWPVTQAIVNADVNNSAAIAGSKIASLVSNDSNNRLLTATGTTNSFNGEANLTFDGDFLTQTIDAAGEGIKITAAGNHWTSFMGDSNRSSPNTWVSHFGGKWNGTTIGSVGILTGADDTNKDEGAVGFYTTPSGGSETERARIDSTGRLLIGTGSSRTVNSASSSLQIEGTGGNNSSFTIVRNQAASGGPAIQFGKTRNASVGGNTVVQDDDQLGCLIFVGNDGTDLECQGARIDAHVDGTPGSNDMPGRLTFSTTADGAVAATERLRITSSGSVLIGTSTSNASDRFTIVDPGSAFMSIRSDSHSDGNSQHLDFGVGTSNRASGNLTAVIEADIHSTSGGTLKSDLKFFANAGDNITERLRITSDGKIGMGTTAPVTNLDVKTEHASNEANLYVRNNTVNYKVRALSDNAQAGTETNHPFHIISNNAFVARFDGDGIKFGNDTAAANGLSDYEEGTHQVSCTMGSSGTVTLQGSYDDLQYTKIGRLVHCFGHIRISSVSSPVGATNFSLPFPISAGTINRGGGVTMYYDNSESSDHMKNVGYRFHEGTSNLQIQAQYITPAASDEILFSFTYWTAS
jgi:hypothetical protein